MPLFAAKPRQAKTFFGDKPFLQSFTRLYFWREERHLSKNLFLKNETTASVYKVIHFIKTNRQSLLYGLALALLLFLLRWLELRLVIIHNALEIYVGAIAVFFTALGIWLALKLARPKVKTVIVEKEIFRETVTRPPVHQPALAGPAVTFGATAPASENLGISKREMEVLGLIAEGLSNQEIAARLFVSLNTVKTHSSNLFEKMEVKRRTQAIEKAKRLGLIA